MRSTHISGHLPSVCIPGHYKALDNVPWLLSLLCSFVVCHALSPRLSVLLWSFLLLPFALGFFPSNSPSLSLCHFLLVSLCFYFPDVLHLLRSFPTSPHHPLSPPLFFSDTSPSFSLAHLLPHSCRTHLLHAQKVSIDEVSWSAGV